MQLRKKSAKTVRLVDITIHADYECPYCNAMNWIEYSLVDKIDVVVKCFACKKKFRI